MKKSLLLTATLIALSANAAKASNEPQTVFTPENNPALVAAAEDLNSVAEKKVETVIPLSPFYEVTARYKDGAKSILKMEANGQIPKDVTIDALARELEKDKADAEEGAATPVDTPFPLIGEGSVVPTPAPSKHVITPGAPVQIARTLEEAATVKAVEYLPPAEVQPSSHESAGAESRQTPGLMTQFPEVVQEDKQGEPVGEPTERAQGLVPGEGQLFSITDPKTWRSAWELASSDQKMAIIVPGALATFLIAFLLGKGNRKPVRIRK